MPTAKPRITLTLEPHVHEVLRRLSSAGGESMSAIVTGFLDVAVPAMERMAVLFEQAKAMPEEAKEGLRASLLRAESELLSGLSGLISPHPAFLDEMVNATAPTGTGRAPRGTGRASAGGSTPVPVTRGSGGREKPEPAVKTVPSKGVRRARV